jgi:septation ring formation regulator EzrA
MTPDQLDDLLMEIECDLQQIRDDIRWFKEQEERRPGELVKAVSSKLTRTWAEA